MQSFDLNNIWEHILQEAKKNMQHLPDALYLRCLLYTSFFISKAHYFIFDGRAVTRAYAFDFATIHRSAVNIACLLYTSNSKHTLYGYAELFILKRRRFYAHL